jgi:hypothetical protein
MLRLNEKRHLTILTVLLLLFVLLGTSVAYSFWDLTTIIVDDSTIVLGEGARLEITQTVNPEQRMVPYGAFKGPNEIDSYTYDYNVVFNKEGRLSVTINPNSIQVGNSENPFKDLVVVQIYVKENTYETARNLSLVTEFITPETSLDLYHITVHVKVFVTKPSNPSDYEAAYLSLIGQSISFTLTFEALQIEQESN